MLKIGGIYGKIRHLYEKISYLFFYVLHKLLSYLLNEDGLKNILFE